MLHSQLQNINHNMMQAFDLAVSFSPKIIINSIIVSVSGIWFCIVSWPSVASNPALSLYFCRQELLSLKPLFMNKTIFSLAEPIAGTPRASTTTPPSRGRKVATNNNQVEEPGLVDLTPP